MNLSPVITAVKTFLGLSDTPASFGGQANKLIRVNSGETALEFGGTTIVLDADCKIYFGATGNNNYFTFSSSSGSWEFYVGGVLKNKFGGS